MSSSARGKCCGEHCADLFDRRDQPVAERRPARISADQRRHRLAPDLGCDLAGNRLVGDDFGAVFGQAEVDQHPGAAMGAALGPDLEAGAPRASRTRAMLDRAGHQRTAAAAATAAAATCRRT